MSQKRDQLRNSGQGAATLTPDVLAEVRRPVSYLSVAMRKSPLVARWRSPVVAT